MPGKGVILAALGHPYYSHMAKNLAVSLLFHNPELEIALIHDDNGVNLLYPEDKTLFKYLIPVKDSKYQDDPYRFKLDLDKLTPFDTTLYLDVDMLWLQDSGRSPMSLMNEMGDTDFMMISRGKVSTDGATLSRWVDLTSIHQAYQIDSVYDISSELIFWNKDTKVFKEARKVYKNPKVEVTKFGLGYPDEAYFMIALSQMGYSLPMDKWEPTYWEPRHFPKQHSREFIGQHYSLSVGGAFTSAHIKKFYNLLNGHYHQSLGIASKPYQLQEKSRIFKERRKI